MDTGPRLAYQMLKSSLLFDNFSIEDYARDKKTDWESVRETLLAAATTPEENKGVEEQLVELQQARFIGSMVHRERKDREARIKKESFARNILASIEEEEEEGE